MTIEKILEIGYTTLFPVLGWFIAYLIVRAVERAYGLSGDLLRKSINNYEAVEKDLKRFTAKEKEKALSWHKRFIQFGRITKDCRKAERRIRLYLFDNAGNKILADSSGILSDIDADISLIQKKILAKQEEGMVEHLETLAENVVLMKKAVIASM